MELGSSHFSCVVFYELLGDLVQRNLLFKVLSPLILCSSLAVQAKHFFQS